MSKDLPPLALIAGPTASGKSALALALAERTGGTIVNADASQVYRDLRVLTARPSPADEARARHCLFGHVDAAQAHDVATWAAEARVAIAAEQAAGRLPILVGGSGLYLRVLIEGIAPIPAIDPDVRAAVRALSPGTAREALAREDPAADARLRPNDIARTARALEVVRATGRPIAAWQAERVGGLGEAVRMSAIVLMPDARQLAARIDARFAAMVDAGACEVDALMARALDPDLPAMSAIGLRAVAAWRRGEIGRDEAVASGQAATRRYAKRQRTWFRHQTPATWLSLQDYHEEDGYDVTSLLIEGLTG